MKTILFNAEMVRAILEDRKTATRRVVKFPGCLAPDKPATRLDNGKFVWGYHPDAGVWIEMEPPYRPCDILYVRETWAFFGCSGCEENEQGRCMFPERRIEDKDGCYVYKATDNVWDSDGMKWRPSIHMPKEAARIFLRVTDVSVERLQEITVDGCKAEGLIASPDIPGGSYISPAGYKFEMQYLWDTTIKHSDLPRYGWDANPWVFVISFKRISKDEAMQ